MNKNILLAIFFILLLLIFVYDSNIQKYAPDTKDTNKTFIKALQIENKALQTSLNEQNNTALPKTIPQTNAPRTMPQTIHLYESISLQEALLSYKPRQNIRPVTAIQLHPKALQKLDIHDTFVLEDIEGVDYPLTVTHIQKNHDGSVTTTGSYTDEGINYTTTMTQSQNESFISLATPQGLYEIETSHGVGYVYKTQDIRKHLQKNTVTDVLILPIPKTEDNML